MKRFGVDQLIGIYYGSLVYTDLFEKKGTTRIYVEAVMGVRNEAFEKRAIWLPGQVTHHDGNDYTVGIVRIPYSLLRYISDNQYVLRDRTPRDLRRVNPRL